MYLFILSAMKKYFASVLLLLSLAGITQAQDYRIGIRVAPALSNVRTSVDGTNTSLERDGTAVKFLLGAFADFQFKENYFFQGGINYAGKSSKISARNGGGPTLNEEYDHEYIQVPLLLKLYTNEVVLDTKVYFNFGVVPEIRLSTSDGAPGNLLITEFKNFDVAGNLGGGVERSIGVNTRVFAGLNYNIGFLNIVDQQSLAADPITLKSNLIFLEIGIKF